MTPASPKREQLQLPFDQYQRYRIIADALDILRKDEGSLRILDVGGGEGTASYFFPDDRLEILDHTVAEGVSNFVEGDAIDMPYEEGHFDYVMSADVYKHIEPDARPQYLSELRRVSNKGVLLAGPFESEAVRAAERLANGLHRAVHHQGNIWLEEREENSLPGLSHTKEFFEEYRDNVTVIPNGYLPHWIAMISLTFYSGKFDDEIQELVGQFNAFYNEFMYRHDNSEPCYRYLVVALKEDREVSFERLVSPIERQNTALSSAFFSTFSSALPTLSRLDRFEKQLAQKDTQLARKEVQIRDLSARLARQTSQASQAEALGRENANLKRQLNAVKNSRAWKALEMQRRLRLFLGNRLKRVR